MNEELLWVLMTMLGYLLGAIPFGVVISKAMGLPDPRTVGSKNVGFTNVLQDIHASRMMKSPPTVRKPL